jgi:hypothetical protein
MFDQVLAKDKFFERLKAEGLSGEEVEKEWELLVKHYQISLMQLGYEKLNPEEQRAAKFGLRPEDKSEDAVELLRRVDEVLTKNPERVSDRSKLVEEAVEMAYSEYVKSKGDVNG